MGRIAETIYTSPEDVARLERLVDDLPVNARVRLQTATGATEGVITVTPTIQVFRDANDAEGTNGLVHLEDPDRPGWSGFVWLSEIESVEHLDSVTKNSSKA